MLQRPRQQRPEIIDLKTLKGLSFRTTKAEALPKFSTIMKLLTDILKQCKYSLPPVHDIFLFSDFNSQSLSQMSC